MLGALGSKCRRADPRQSSIMIGEFLERDPSVSNAVWPGAFEPSLTLGRKSRPVVK
jgi:hypothetical protein